MKPSEFRELIDGAGLSQSEVARQLEISDRTVRRCLAARAPVPTLRDQGIRRRRLETDALKAHGVAAFAFTGGQETAQTIYPLLVKFANMNVSEPKPFLCTFGVSGASKVKF